MSLENLQDRLAIEDLLNRYCEGVNQRDADIWGSTWADDATWELPHLDMEGLKGKETIVASWLEAMKLFPFVNMMAQIGSLTIQGDKATMRSYTDEVAVTQDGTEIRPRGQYDDECVKINGEWKFARRKFTVLHGE
ncbi:MAG: nuclear transport factor 2 family protein [Parvibaculales bacterium]